MKSVLYDIAESGSVGENEDLATLARRAERSGDHELADFFRRVERERSDRADEAERLLAARLAE